MIQRIERLHAELELETLGQMEILDGAQVEIPIRSRAENIAPGAVAARGGEGELIDVVKDHRAHNACYFVIVDRRRGSHDVGTRGMREIGSADAAGDAERF